MEDWCYSIVYETVNKGDRSEQVAVVCATLEKALEWLAKEPVGKSWAGLARFDGTGEKMRLITDFGEHEWTSYSIRRTVFVG